MRTLRPGSLRQVLATASLLFGAGCVGSIGGEGGTPSEDTATTSVELSVTPHVVRLSNAQWQNAARDALMGTDALTKDVTALPGSPESFDTDYEKLVVGAEESGALSAAADKVAQRLVADKNLLSTLTAGATGKEGAATLLKSVSRRAFRRTLDAAELSEFMAVYDASLTQADPGVDGPTFAMQQLVSSILQSPDFVYRMELGDGDGRTSNIKGTELATKAAFALWNTGPTDALLDKAEKGELDTKQGFEAVVDMMLKDPKADAVLARFHAGLFGLEKIRTIARDGGAFPKAYEGMGPDLAEELSRFVKYVVIDEQEGGGWRAMLTSRTAFVNQKLAKLYDVPTSASPDLSDPTKWAQVSLPEGQRAGFPTRAGLLAYYSNGVNPSSIRRGKFMVESVACITVPPPAKQIILNFDSGIERTNRKRTEAKTKGCGAGCHGNGRDEVGALGPLGYAFESYDAAGIFRTMENGEPVDSASTLQPYGQFNNASELLGRVAETEASHGCYAREWTRYLIGRHTSVGENVVVNSVGGKSHSGAKVRELLRAIVTSDLFRIRKNES